MALLAGCSDTPTPPADTSAADQKAIRDGDTAWPGDLASKDIDKIMAHYADDASLLVTDMPIMRGKDAIRSGMKGMLEDPNFALTFKPDVVQVAKGGDLGYTQGAYTMTTTNPRTKKAETETGKYLTVYRKQTDGSWKAIEDIANADAPAVAVAGKAAPVAKGAAKKHRKR